jgi:hypothetical protein
MTIQHSFFLHYACGVIILLVAALYATGAPTRRK